MNNLSNREWTCLERKLLLSTAFLLGLVIGFVFSPIKKGIYCGNHNGSRHFSNPNEPL